MMGGATITGNAAVVQVPVAMDAYLAFPVGLGRLEPGLGVNLNVISATSSRRPTQGTKSERRHGCGAAASPHRSPGGFPLPHDLFVRAHGDRGGRFAHANRG